MATEKILNTRISLKVDTLENWGKSTLPLKKGEVAFATVAATAGNGLTEPVVMMKIGEDGVKTFKDIEWNFYAKASDVLASAKSEEALRTFINGVIADAGIASSDAMEALAKRVTDTENDIKTLNGDESTAGSVAKAIKDAIDALDLANTYVAQEDGKSLMTEAEHNKLAGISEGATKVENVGGGKIKIDGTEVAVYTHPDKHTASEISDFATEVAKVKVTNADQADWAENATYFGGKEATAYVLKDEAEGYGDILTKTEASTLYAKADVFGSFQGFVSTIIGDDGGKSMRTVASEEAADVLADAKKYADDNDANTEYHVEYDSVNKKIKLVAGADASKMEIPTDDFIKDGMIQSVEIKENNLVITWNTDAGKSATSIPLTELVDVMTGVDGTTITVNVSADDKISAEVKAGTITTSHIAANAGIVKTQLHAEVQTSLGLADTAIQEADLGTMAKEAAADYVKKTEATGYDDILTKTAAQSAYQAKGSYATAAQGEKADTALQKADITTGTANGTIAVDGADVAVNGLGSAAFTDSTAYATSAQGATADANAQTLASLGIVNGVVAQASRAESASYFGGKLPTEYATAAQGGKADTAIQSVTSVAGNGIKATTNGTAVTIDWDSEVTLVFDCGGSGVTA